MFCFLEYLSSHVLRMLGFLEVFILACIKDVFLEIFVLACIKDVYLKFLSSCVLIKGIFLKIFILACIN